MSPAGDGPDGVVDRYSFSYAPDAADQPTSAIVEAISWVEGVEAAELEPLADWVDPDALNALFGGRTRRGSFKRTPNGPAPANLRVVFEYADYVITVDSDLITVRPE